MSEIFNYEKALERFMGEKEILLEVLPPYLEALESNLNKLNNLDPASQCQEIRDIAHSIKGSSLNLEINTLGKCAETLEDAAYDKDTKLVIKAIPSVKEASKNVIAEIKKYL